MNDFINALITLKTEDIVQLYEFQKEFEGSIIGDSIKISLCPLQLLRSKYGKFSI